MYELTWVTTQGLQRNSFPTWEAAAEYAKATLLDEYGIAGSVWPNHNLLTEADDRLYHGVNIYCGITRKGN